MREPGELAEAVVGLQGDVANLAACVRFLNQQRLVDRLAELEKRVLAVDATNAALARRLLVIEEAVTLLERCVTVPARAGG